MEMKSPEVRTQNIGDAEIQYLFYDGVGPTIIMLHATGFLPWMWHPIARELAGKFKVIAPYYCDHREADPHQGGLSWALLAEDLVEFCRRLNTGKAMLVGHSMGATIITLAEANHPGFAEKIILIEPIFLPENIYGELHRVEDHPLASKSIKRRNFWKDAAEAAEYLRTRALFKNWAPEMLELYLKYGMKQAGGGLVLACSPAQEAALFMGGAARNPWPEISKVRCPVLVVEGGESENRGFIDSKKIASLFPNGEYHLVPGAGHLIPMEMPKEIFKLIDSFFSPPLKA